MHTCQDNEWHGEAELIAISSRRTLSSASSSGVRKQGYFLICLALGDRFTGWVSSYHYFMFCFLIRCSLRFWQPTPVLLPGKSHGRGSLVGCSPWGCYKSDTTERLHFHFSLSCIGEGDGNPLQCSCLESPRDGGAWWAAVYGVAQSRTRLKWLSSSSSTEVQCTHREVHRCACWQRFPRDHTCVSSAHIM